jgi:hypothetical protein
MHVKKNIDNLNGHRSIKAANPPIDICMLLLPREVMGSTKNNSGGEESFLPDPNPTHVPFMQYLEELRTKRNYVPDKYVFVVESMSEECKFLKCFNF